MLQKQLEQLKVFYLLVFGLGIALVAPTHIFPMPAFMYARFPHYLEMMPPLFGVKWPMTFEIYHYVLYILGVIISLNALGILVYPKFKNVAILSSIIGGFLISLIILFLFLIFLKVNVATTIAYGLYSLFLLTVDLLTFKFLIAGKQRHNADGF